MSTFIKLYTAEMSFFVRLASLDQLDLINDTYENLQISRNRLDDDIWPENMNYTKERYGETFYRKKYQL